jgi:hypothetical protein
MSYGSQIIDMADSQVDRYQERRVSEISDPVAAAAFRRLLEHLRARPDVANIDLMGMAGFCRNCLADWVSEASDLTRDDARQLVYGMPYADWKATQPEATPEQLARLKGV